MISKESIRNFLRIKQGLIGLIVLITFTLIAIFADFITPYKLGEFTFKEQPFQQSSLKHWLGTNQ